MKYLDDESMHLEFVDGFQGVVKERSVSVFLNFFKSPDYYLKIPDEDAAVLCVHYGEPLSRLFRPSASYSPFYSHLFQINFMLRIVHSPLRRPRDPLPSETVKFTVTEAVDVDWCNLSQSVKPVLRTAHNIFSAWIERSIVYQSRRLTNNWYISSVTLSDSFASSLHSEVTVTESVASTDSLGHTTFAGRAELTRFEICTSRKRT